MNQQLASGTSLPTAIDKTVGKAQKEPVCSGYCHPLVHASACPMNPRNGTVANAPLSNVSVIPDEKVGAPRSKTSIPIVEASEQPQIKVSAQPYILSSRHFDFFFRFVRGVDRIVLELIATETRRRLTLTGC